MNKFHKQYGDALIALTTIKNILFIFLFIVALDRLLMPTTIFIGPDSVGYLGPALRFFSTGNFMGIAERPYVYPLILKKIIEHSNDIKSIVIFQRVFFICGVVLLYLSLCNLSLSKPLKIGLRNEVKKLLILLVCIFFATQFWQIFIEQWCAPEALTFGLMAILLYSSVEIFFSNSITSRGRVFSVLAFGSASYLLITMQARYWIPTILLNLIIFFKIYRLELRTKSRFILILLLIMQYVVCSFTMFKNYSHSDAVENTRVATFFYYNLNTLDRIIKSDIENGRLNKLEAASAKDILATYLESKQENLRSYSSGAPPSIGYNTDYMMNAHTRTLQKHSYDFKKVTEFYLKIINGAGIDFYIGVIKRVVRDFYFYTISQNFFRAQPYDSYQMNWMQSLNTLQSFPIELLNSSYAKQLKFELISSTNINHSNTRISDKFLSGFFKVANILFIPIIAIGLLLGISSRDCFQKWKSIRYFFISLVCLLLASLLNISLGASLYYERYVYDMLLMNGLVFSLSILRIACTLRNFLKK